MKRLVEQAACEEHGQFGTHCPHPYHSLIACSRPCPGGSSREVTVDYEAAWDDAAEFLYGTTWEQLGDAEKRYVADAVSTFVDAVLPSALRTGQKAATRRELAIRQMVEKWEMIGEIEATKLVDGVLAALGGGR